MSGLLHNISLPFYDSCTLDPAPTWLINEVKSPTMTPILPKLFNAKLHSITFSTSMTHAILTQIAKKSRMDLSVH